MTEAQLKEIEENMTPFPWERRGWKFYVKGTQKVVFEVRLAWKSSAEAEATAKYIQHAINELVDRRMQRPRDAVS